MAAGYRDVRPARPSSRSRSIVPTDRAMAVVSRRHATRRRRSAGSIGTRCSSGDVAARRTRGRRGSARPRLALGKRSRTSARIVSRRVGPIVGLVAGPDENRNVVLLAGRFFVRLSIKGPNVRLAALGASSPVVFQDLASARQHALIDQQPARVPVLLVDHLLGLPAVPPETGGDQQQQARPEQEAALPLQAGFAEARV